MQTPTTYNHVAHPDLKDSVICRILSARKEKKKMVSVPAHPSEKKEKSFVISYTAGRAVFVVLLYRYNLQNQNDLEKIRFFKFFFILCKIA